VTRGNPVVCPFALRIPPLRKTCAVDELIGHALKCGDDDHGGAHIDRIQDDSPDVHDAIGCGERRSAELEHSDAAEPSDLSRSFHSRAPSKPASTGASGQISDESDAAASEQDVSVSFPISADTSAGRPPKNERMN